MMQPSRLRILVLAAGALTLASCSTVKGLLESDKVDYKSAGKMQPLEIPPDLTRPGGGDTYVVPEINPTGAATYSAYSRERATASDPSRASILPAPQNVRIERFGDQRWLVVKSEPAPVWNLVREFWQEIGFIIDSENPEAGVMETDWAETYTKVPDDSTVRNLLAKLLRNTKIGVSSPVAAGERIKFRTRLERGVEAGTTEIYISHRGMEEVLSDRFVADERLSGGPQSSLWKSRPPDPSLEAEMLTRLMARFGVKQELAKAEVAAAVQAPAPLRATLLKGQDGTGMLSLNDQFDRAWRRVGLALDRVGFTVEDRDRSKGLYFVRYVDPDADNKSAAQSKSFFSKLNPFSKDDKKSATSGSSAGDQFRIQVRDANTVSEINVLGKDGSQEKSTTANRILGLLYEQLK